jgi:hypothetical protein
MVASSPSVDPDAIQESASRYADMALTANYAATALRMMAEDPEREIPDRYLRALKEMAATFETMVRLENRDRLSALIDRSLGVVEDLEPAQLVARLATGDQDNSEAKETLHKFVALRNDLSKILKSPDAKRAERLIPTFKYISRQAMVQAQDAQDRLGGFDEAFIHSRVLYA